MENGTKSHLHYTAAASKDSLEIVCDIFLYIIFHRFSQAGNIIQEKLNHSCFLVKFSRKSVFPECFWVTASDFRQRFRRIVSNICLLTPKIAVCKHFTGFLVPKYSKITRK